MKSLGVVFIMVVLGGLTACNGKPQDIQNFVGVGEERLGENDFEAHLKLKRIPAQAGDRRERAKETYLSRQTLAKAIAKESTLDRATLEAELREFRNELLISRYFERFLSQAVSDEAVKAYYDSNKEKYRQRKAKALTLVFSIPPGRNEKEKERKRAQAEAVRKRIAEGARFEKVAEEVIGAKPKPVWLTEGQIDPLVAKTVFNIKVEEVSGLIVTEHAYYIVKLLEAIEEGAYRTFDVVKGEIRYRMRQRKKAEEVKRLLGNVEPSVLG